MCVQDFYFLFSKKEKLDISINLNSCFRNAVACYIEAQGEGLQNCIFSGKILYIHSTSYLFRKEHFLMVRPLATYVLA